jgi:hypothetical protein
MLSFWAFSELPLKFNCHLTALLLLMSRYCLSLSYTSTMELLEAAPVDAYLQNDFIVPASRHERKPRTTRQNGGRREETEDDETKRRTTRQNGGRRDKAEDDETKPRTTRQNRGQRRAKRRRNRKRRREETEDEDEQRR